ncbi:MAG TPA: hypothetical protein VG963_07175, partial [Polyangiaceae bacterium]|nr:hypothetical protein [Polyangiaceae bacterium]
MGRRTASLLAICLAACGCGDGTHAAREAGPGTDHAPAPGASDRPEAGAAALPDAGGSRTSASDAAVASFDAAQADATRAPSGKSELSACLAFYEAQCQQRFYACQGPSLSYLDCLTLQAHCPDTLFAPGSSYTADDVFDCASAFGQLGCTDADLAKRPACLKKGTRASGQTCVYAAQCASGRCTGSPRACGTCVEPVPIGGACGAQVCVDGAVCTGGTCNSPAQTPGVLRRGEACARGDECEYDYACVADASSNGGMRCV